MSKLLMYEEENLMPDSTCDDVYNESKPTGNAPLISPQSTLTDKPLHPPPGLLPKNTSSNLAVILEECMDKSDDNVENGASNLQLSNSLRSNPFLQDEKQFDTYVNTTVESVIKNWLHNLALQIPILKAYNGYLARLSGQTKKVPKEMIVSVDEATNNLVSRLNVVAHFLNNIESVQSTTPFTFGDNYGINSVPTINNYQKNVLVPDILSSPFDAASQNWYHGRIPSPVHEYHRMQPIFINAESVSPNPFDNAKYGQATLLQTNNNLNSTILSQYNGGHAQDTLCFNNDDLGLSDIATRVQAIAVNTNMYDVKHENSDISGGIDFSESTTVENTPVRKETNPFRMGFVDSGSASRNETQRRTVPAPIASPKKSRNTNNINLNSSQRETRANVTNSPRYELFAGKAEQGLNRNESFVNIPPCNIFNFDNKPIISKRNLFTEGYMDDNRNVSCSYFTSDNATSLLGVNCSTNGDMPTTLQTPFAVPTLPLTIDSLNLDDEGYLTRPPTSNTLESSSPLGLTSEVETSEQSVTANTDHSSCISAESWLKAVENSIANNSPVLNHQNVMLTTSNRNECANSDPIILNLDNTVNFCKFPETDLNGESDNLIELADSDGKDLHEDVRKNLEELNISKLRKISNTDCEDVLSTVSCTSVLFFQAVELTQGLMYVFHFEGTGWLSVDEFTETFTDFKSASSMLKMTNILDVEISLKEIDRFDHPSVFAELDSSSLKASRDSQNEISKISMISLRSGLTLMVKCNVIDPEDFSKGKYEEGSILFEVYTLVNAYKDLKRQLNGIRSDA